MTESHERVPTAVGAVVRTSQVRRAGSPHEANGVGQEGVLVTYRGQQAVLSRLNEFMRCRVIKCADGETAAQRLSNHVAKCFRDAGVKVDIARGVKAREVDSRIETSEDGVGPLTLIIRKERTIADENQACPSVRRIDRIEGTEEQGR